MRKYFYITLSILALVAYSFVVYAAAPAGGYQITDQQLDPDCAPGDTDCVVVFPTEVERGTGVPGSTPSGGDPLVYIDDANGDMYTWDAGSSGWERINGFDFDVSSSNMWVPIAGSGDSFTSGYENLFIGVAAGEHTDTGYNNTFVGYRAGRNNTSGHGITALGSNAGTGNTIGNDNLSFGSYAGYGISTSSGSIMIGNNAGYNSNAGNNMFIGHYAGNNNTSGAGNVFLGNNAGLANSIGVNNTLVGFQANVIGGSVSNATAIGKDVVAYVDNQFVSGSELTPMNDVVFGKGDRSTAPSDYTLRATNGAGTNVGGASLILAGGKGTGSSTGGTILFKTSDSTSSGTAVQSYSTKMTLSALGNLGVGDATPDYRLDVEDATTTGIIASFTSADGTCTLDVSDVSGWTCPSDRNLKKDITNAGDMLGLVNQLHPVTYRMKTEAGTDLPSIGLIAQDVQTIFPKLVKTQADGTLAMNYGGLIVPLVKSVQELDVKFNNVDAQASRLMANATFQNQLAGWLGGIANNITLVIADTFKARNQICIDDVCMTKEQLRALLQSQNSTPVITPQPESEPQIENPAPESIPDPEIQPDSTPESVPTPETLVPEEVI
jgi:hypothetical protein